MITNTKIELSDEQRLTLSRVLGLGSKPATRKQISEFVGGCVKAVLDLPSSLPEAPRSGRVELSRAKYFDALAEHLRKNGNNAGAVIAARTANELRSES